VGEVAGEVARIDSSGNGVLGPAATVATGDKLQVVGNLSAIAGTFNGVGTFSGARPITVSGSTGATTYIGDSAGWVIGSQFFSSTGADLGYIGAYGSGNSLIRMFLEPFGSEFVTFTSTVATFVGKAPQISKKPRTTSQSISLLHLRSLARAQSVPASKTYKADSMQSIPNLANRSTTILKRPSSQSMEW